MRAGGLRAAHERARLRAGARAHGGLEIRAGKVLTLYVFFREQGSMKVVLVELGR